MELGITLLLTAVAFKYTTSSYLPQISYLTLVDKFSMLGTLVIVVGCLAHTVLGFLDGWVGISEAALDRLSKVFFALILLSWIGTQIWFVCMERRVRGQKSFNRELLERQMGTRHLAPKYRT